MVCSTSRRVFGNNLRGQLYGHCLPEEPRRDSFFSSELHRSENSPLGGESSGCDFPQVYYGEAQRPSGCSVSPKSDSGLRMDSEAGGLQGYVQEVAGVDRPIRNISKSTMFNIFFSLPRSQCSGDGCSSSELGWVAGVCLSSLVPHSSSSEEAPVVLWGPADHHSAILAPRPWFPDLLDLVVDGPIALPQSKDLLRQPHFHRFHLGVSRLSLHAWRLSSDSPVLVDSPSV